MKCFVYVKLTLFLFAENVAEQTSSPCIWLALLGCARCPGYKFGPPGSMPFFVLVGFENYVATDLSNTSPSFCLVVNSLYILK